MSTQWLKTSLRNKIVLLLLVSTVLPISFGFFTAYFQTTDSIKQSTIEENTRLLSKGAESISFYFDLVNQGTISVYEVGNNNKNLMDALKRDPMDYEKIHVALLYIHNFLNYFEQINLYKTTTGESFLFRNYLTSRGSLTDDSYRTKDTRNIFIEPPHRTTNYKTTHLLTNPDKMVITFHRKIYDIPFDTLLGYISIDISIDALTNLTDDLYNPEVEKLSILDVYSNKVVYASGNKDIGQTIPFSWYESLDPITSPSYIEDSEKKTMYLLYPIKKNFMNWLIVKEIPYKVLYQPAQSIANINILLAIVLTLLMIGVATLVSVYFTRPIKALIKDMDKIKKGELEGDIQITRNDELGILEKNYQEMMESLRDLIRNKYTLEIANKENQIRVLQAQINPHFIGNVLQAIGTESLEHGDMIVYSLILKLSHMMTYSMETSNTMVPLKKELDYTVNYLELQRIRFEGQFTYETSLPQELENFHVPKMILQPLVENYFKHGFQRAREEGTISLSCSVENNLILITVDNNGSSIAESELASLQHSLTDNNYADRQIGLTNIAKRLSLYYNDRAQLRIENLHPGVRIQITIFWEDLYEDTHS